MRISISTSKTRERQELHLKARATLQTHGLAVHAIKAETKSPQSLRHY
jgi:hypothetical protein